MIFSTDCSQSIGLQSVLKTRVKTSKLFALQASPYKGSKPWVNLDAFVFSKYHARTTQVRARYVRESEHLVDHMLVNLVLLYSCQLPLGNEELGELWVTYRSQKKLENQNSDFGLRQQIKLIELRWLTRSEFWFSMVQLRKSRHNVPNPDSVPPVYPFLPILLLQNKN